MLGADNLRKIAGYDFHLLRKKYDVRTMWGDLDPQWRLLQSQLETRGPGWYSPAELKERLFTNKSKRPGDDTKEALRTDGNTIAWQAWDTARNIIWQSCQPGPPLVFPGELGIMNGAAKAHTPHWTSFLPIGTRSSGRSHSSLDAEVGFNKNVVNSLAQWLTGWAALISSLRMRANNTAIWKRLPL